MIDRKDQVINLFELKFYSSAFRLSKSGARELREKIATFRAVTGTRKQVFLNLITPFGLIPNEHSIGLVDQDFTMDILFKTDDH